MCTFHSSLGGGEPARKLETPADRAMRRLQSKYEAEARDARLAHIELGKARKAWQWLAGAAFALFVALLYVCSLDPPAPALECPASGVMQLDPTTVRARASEAVEI